MPQMMPMNWLSMFMSLNLMLILFMIIIFNSVIQLPNQITKKNPPISSTKWAW